MTALVIDRVRCGGSGATPDGGTTRSVGDIHLLAEELCDKAGISCFRTACAGSGELEQGLIELAALDCCICKGSSLLCYVVYSVIESGLLIELGLCQNHFESSLLGLCRADVHAERAAHTVERRNSDCEFIIFATLTHHLSRELCASGSLCGFVCVHSKGTDSGVRTYIRALVALDAVFSVPYGNLDCNAALVISGSALRICAVCAILECGNGERIALHSVYGACNVVYKLDKVSSLAFCGSLCSFLFSRLPAFGNVYLDSRACACVDSGVVEVDNSFALLGI